MVMNLSCGLLQCNVSRDNIELITRALTCASEVVFPAKNGDEYLEKRVSDSLGIVQFFDDLRMGELKYITDTSGRCSFLQAIFIDLTPSSLRLSWPTVAR